MAPLSQVIGACWSIALVDHCMLPDDYRLYGARVCSTVPCRGSQLLSSWSGHGPVSGHDQCLHRQSDEWYSPSGSVPWHMRTWWYYISPNCHCDGLKRRPLVLLLLHQSCHIIIFDIL